MDIPTTAIRIPSAAVIASAVSSESERLSLLNNDGGKILEATLQFEHSQQYAGMSSVLGIMVDDELVVSLRKLMPLKCRFYVGDDSDGDDDYYGLQAAAAAADASAEPGGWTAVGDAIGFYRPKVIDQLVDGIKCFAWIEETDGLPVGFSDERRGNIDAVLLSYLDGVSDRDDDDDDDVVVSDDLLSSVDGASD